MARPPVCKLMDYGKFKYESAQKAREARRNQALTVIKEMKLRPKIDSHDYETKKGHVERFLKAGRQGQDHDHVPRPRAVPARAGLPAAAAAGRGHRRARLRRVHAEAGRPQHGHGRRAAPQPAEPPRPRQPSPELPSRPTTHPRKRPNRPTELAEPKRRHAEEQDPQRDEEARQGHRHAASCSAERAGKRHMSSTSPRTLTRRLTGTTRSPPPTPRAQEAARPLSPARQTVPAGALRDRPEQQGNTVARVKRAVNAQKKRRSDPRALGLPGSAFPAVPQGQGAAAPLRDLRLPRPQGPQG